MDELHFLRPAWLLAVPVWLGLVIWVRRLARADISWDRVCDPELAPYVVDAGASGRSPVWHLLAALGGVLVALALAGPVWRELPQPVFRTQSSLVVALDVSRSMNATDIEPSRLVRARHKVLDLLDRRVDGQTALVAYAGDAFAVTPLTDDNRTIASLVPSLEPDIMPLPGSRADRAIDRARELLRQAGARRGQVLLVTDSAEGPDLDRAVERLKSAGYTLSVIGVGKPGGAPIPDGEGFIKSASGDIVLAKLDETALAALAKWGGGTYARYGLDDADIRRVLLAGPSMQDEAANSTLNTDRWREEGPWLVPLLMLLVLPLFRRGRLD